MSNQLGNSVERTPGPNTVGGLSGPSGQLERKARRNVRKDKQRRGRRKNTPQTDDAPLDQDYGNEQLVDPESPQEGDGGDDQGHVVDYLA
jgi:hypothetical protein